MFDDPQPLDADELMEFAERIEQLDPLDAEWVSRLFQECLRARMIEAEHLADALAPVQPEMGEFGEINTDSTDSALSGSGEMLSDQLAQLVLDAAEWLKTLWQVGYMGASGFPAQPRQEFPLVDLEDVLKSALFTRIRAGKRPLPFPPPTRNGEPWHELFEAQGIDYPVTAEVIRDEAEGLSMGLIIEGCLEWRIIEEIVADREYLVQHRNKGPFFNLRLCFPDAYLRREAPRWTFQILTQERGGFRSYSLEWPDANGKVLSIPLRAATWERAESEADYWIASKFPEKYGQVRFERSE